MEPHIRCLTQACQRLGLAYRFLDAEQNFVQIDTGRLHFQLNKTPFNSEAMAGICRDKAHTFQLFGPLIPMPYTSAFLDYQIEAPYRQYLRYDAQDAIIHAIEAEYDYPLVIKRNRGYLGVNVFLCHNQDQIRTALDAIFDKTTPNYDYVALAQEYVQPAAEYRLVTFRGEPLLAYERASTNKVFNVRYWESAEGRAVHITDADLLEELQTFIAPACGFAGLEFVGFDILREQSGALKLLELNSSPKFNHFILNNGEEAVIRMYEKMLN